MTQPAWDDPRSLYCGELREALRDCAQAFRRQDKILQDLAMPASITALLSESWHLETLEELLAQDTGRISEQLWRNAVDINCICFLLADALYAHLYGVPRSPSGVVPTTSELIQALEELHTLVEEAQRLERLRAPAASPSEEPNNV